MCVCVCVCGVRDVCVRGGVVAGHSRPYSHTSFSSLVWRRHSHPHGSSSDHVRTMRIAAVDPMEILYTVASVRRNAHYCNLPAIHPERGSATSQLLAGLACLPIHLSSRWFAPAGVGVRGRRREEGRRRRPDSRRRRPELLQTVPHSLYRLAHFFGEAVSTVLTTPYHCHRLRI